MLIDAPPPLLSTITHKKHLSHFMAKTMNELAHKSPLITIHSGAPAAKGPPSANRFAWCDISCSSILFYIITQVILAV